MEDEMGWARGMYVEKKVESNGFDPQGKRPCGRTSSRWEDIDYAA
jgi:hypothetical protein